MNRDIGGRRNRKGAFMNNLGFLVIKGGRAKALRHYRIDFNEKWLNGTDPFLAVCWIGEILKFNSGDSILNLSE